MALSEDKIRKFTEKLMLARMNIMMNIPFFGSLLMHVKLSVDENCETAYTDTKRICFGTKFLETLTGKEIEFVMMHEIMHIVLQHCKRGLEYNQFLFNLACDIVVNSIILETNGMDLSSITLKKYGESIHTVPDGSEGALYSAEEVYFMLLKKADHYKIGLIFTDDHSKWSESDVKPEDGDIWLQRVVVAAETAERMGAGKQKCKLPRFAEEILFSMRNRNLDWRNLLHTFIEDDVCDYSFNPPDKRFQNTEFFIPDFNDFEGVEKAKKILFMIDTSASISDETISEFFSEIESALEQFNGRLEGLLGFFDTEVVEPLPFENTDDLKGIKPFGGGGTSFKVIFKYITENMKDDLPVSIVIFTDGYANFPDESEANGIPVLWVIYRTKVTPPWGTVARIEK